MPKFIPGTDGTGGCLLVIVAFFAVILYAAAAEPIVEPKSSPMIVRHMEGPRYYHSEIVKVVDGDTVDVRFKVWTDITLEKRIRFEGIDTWEIRGENKEKGLKAREFLINLLSKGKVYLQTTGKTGKYGRTIGSLHVLVESEVVNVSAQLKSNGHEKN